MVLEMSSSKSQGSQDDFHGTDHTSHCLYTNITWMYLWKIALVSSRAHHAVSMSNLPLSLLRIKVSLKSKVPLQAMKCMGEWRSGCTHSLPVP